MPLDSVWIEATVVETASLPSHWMLAVEEAKAQARSEVRVTANAALTDDLKPENPKVPMCVLLET
jgi:hypothetical protein